MCCQILTTVRALDYHNQTLDEFIKYIDLIRQTEYKYINLNFRNLSKISNFEKNRLDILKEYKEYLSCYGITTPISHARYENTLIFGENISIENKLQNEIIEDIKSSKFLGVKIIVVHAGISFVNGNYDEEKTIIDNVKFFLPISIIAQNEGIILAIENNVVENNSQNGNCVEPNIKIVNQIVEKINQNLGQKNVGICFDVGHANLVGENLSDAIIKYKDNLKTLHLHNNFGVQNKEKIWSNDIHNPIYDGDISIGKIFQTLHKVGFNNYIVNEALYRGDTREIIEKLKRDYDYFKKYI